jgi:hypothetical protein
VSAALGGSENLAGVRSLRVSGTTSAHLVGPKSRGYPLGRLVVNLEEIQIILPEHYLLLSAERSTAPTAPPVAPAAWPMRQGFVGDTPIGSSSIRRAKEEFGYLVLCLLLRTDSAFSFQLQGLSDNSLRFSSAGGDVVFMDLNPVSHLPRLVRFETDVYTPRGERTGERVIKRIEISDYRPVGRLRLAHKLVEFHGERPNPITRQLERIELNPRLNLADFK